MIIDLSEIQILEKKKLSFREFINWSREYKISKVIFNMELQEDYFPENPFKINMSFPVAQMHENPNVICLRTDVKADTGYILIHRIKWVEVATCSSVDYAIVNLCCGNRFNEDNNYSISLYVS